MVLADPAVNIRIQAELSFLFLTPDDHPGPPGLYDLDPHIFHKFGIVLIYIKETVSDIDLVLPLALFAGDKVIKTGKEGNHRITVIGHPVQPFRLFIFVKI